MTTSLCPRCLRSESAQTLVRANGILGDCPSCGAKVEPIIKIEEIASAFHDLLINCHELGQISTFFIESPIPHEQLPSILESDGLDPFAPSLTPARQIVLLNALLLCHSEGRLRLSNASRSWVSVFTQRHPIGSSPWERLRDHICHKRRYVVDFADPSVPNLPHLLKEVAAPFTLILPQDVVLYRARLHDDSNRDFSFQLPEELHAPPPHLARAARANPAGIPILYASDSLETAISEVRPFLGALVCIATVQPDRPLKLFDFSRSPAFSNFDPLSTSLNCQIEARSLIVSLDHEFAEPVAPHLPDRDYAPTQFVAELVASLGFDGIVYRSAVKEKGINYAFFDPSHLHSLRHSSQKVCQVKVSSTPYDFTDPYGLLAYLAGPDHEDPDEGSPPEGSPPNP